MNTKINSPAKQGVLSALSFQPSVEIIEDGYALCEQQTLKLVYCNKTFKNWFNINELYIGIEQIFLTLKTEILLKRLAKRGTYTLSIEPDQYQQGLPKLCEISFKSFNEGEQLYIAIHVHNMTKLLEKDALIQSHSRIIEQSNRQLAKLTQQLKTENNRLNAEMEVTHQLQKLLLPTEEELLLIDTLDIACFMEPANEIGGDYYDILQHSSGVRMCIGDVTGHGLESGVVMLMVQMGIRTLLAAQINNSTQMLSILNQAIFANIVRIKAEKSLSLTVLDYQDGKVRVTGQHEEIIIVRKGGKIERLDTMNLGFPIGLEQDITDFIAETHLFLQAGDGIVLYTDGITEAENSRKEQFEMQRLCAVIEKNWSKTASSIRDAIIAELFNFIAGHTIFDDITLVVMKQK